MSALRRDLRGAIEAALRENGVAAWTLDTASGHHKYRFRWQGRDLMFVTAGSPSDRRGLQNALTELRLLLGVKRAVKKNRANRAKPYRKRPKPLPPWPVVTILPNPWEKLAVLYPENGPDPMALRVPTPEDAAKDQDGAASPFVLFWRLLRRWFDRIAHATRAGLAHADPNSGRNGRAVESTDPAA